MWYFHVYIYIRCIIMYILNPTHIICTYAIIHHHKNSSISDLAKNWPTTERLRLCWEPFFLRFCLSRWDQWPTDGINRTRLAEGRLFSEGANTLRFSWLFYMLNQSEWIMFKKKESNWIISPEVRGKKKLWNNHLEWLNPNHWAPNHQCTSSSWEAFFGKQPTPTHQHVTASPIILGCTLSLNVLKRWRLLGKKSKSFLL